MKIGRNKIVLFIISLLLLGGCSTDISENAARLRIKLTDAPTLSAESFVVSELQLHIKSLEVSVTDSSDSTDTAEEEWIPLEFSGGEYDMLTLSNGKTVQIVDQYFPANQTIRKIKLTLGNNNKIISTSESYHKDLIIAEEAKNGIIVEVNENLYANIISYLVLDINMALSIREDNGNYFLNPVVRAFSEVYTGSMTGVVAPLEAKPFVCVIKDSDTLYTIPEPDGMFMFPGLGEGNWTIYIFADPYSGYKDTTFIDSVFIRKTTELKPNPIQLHSIVDENL